jgi:alcohol dehydrogenase class IV
MTIHQFAFPTRIHFGAGARKLVAEHLRQQGLKRPLIVTDKGLGRCRSCTTSPRASTGWT